MSASLSRQRVLVTGSGVRIGRAIATSLAEAGASVVLHCNRSQAEAGDLLAQLRAETPGRHELIRADLCDSSQVQQLVGSLLEDGRPLHGLINNASVYRRKPLLKAGEEDFLRDYRINFLAPFLLMRDFARLCGRGFVINLLDQRVATVDPAAGMYALAKKSLRDATEAAALEWAPHVRVNAVAPGFSLPPPGVPAERMQPLLANVPLLRASPPQEIAQACLFLARAETVTGQILYVDGGTHLAPRLRPEIGEADYGPGAGES